MKNLTAENTMRKESVIFLASLVARSEPMSSTLGMEIFCLGATLVLQEIKRH